MQIYMYANVCKFAYCDTATLCKCISTLYCLGGCTCKVIKQRKWWKHYISTNFNVKLLLKILKKLRIQLGFEPRTFWLVVRHSYHWATGSLVAEECRIDVNILRISHAHAAVHTGFLVGGGEEVCGALPQRHAWVWIFKFSGGELRLGGGGISRGPPSVWKCTPNYTTT